MIPKVIHYCWYGKKEKPALVNKCIDSWKRYCPGYDIIEWNEDNTNLSMNRYVSLAYLNNKWAFLSDYMRLYIVYNNGGIYLDTDVELLRNMDDLLDQEFFLGCETRDIVATGLGFGAEKGNKIIGTMIEEYNMRITEDDEIEFIACPERNTAGIHKYIDDITFDEYGKCSLCGGTLYSPEYFCPLNYETKVLKLEPYTYSIHHFSGSWLSPFSKFKSKVKSYLIRYFHYKSRKTKL